MGAVALVVAAGSGERLGASVPKAFAALGGRPMIEWSIDALRQVAEIEQIVVAVPAGYPAPPGTVGVPGGATRSASVRAALAMSGDGDPVVVHDAARPLVRPELFESALEELRTRRCDAVVTAARVSDTIKEVDAIEGRVTSTLDRSRLWAVQTPQVFRRTVLQRALEGHESLLNVATDDAWLVERGGGDVRVVSAPRENLKITEPFDLRLAELLLAERARAAQPPEPQATELEGRRRLRRRRGR